MVDPFRIFLKLLYGISKNTNDFVKKLAKFFLAFSIEIVYNDYSRKEVKRNERPTNQIKKIKKFSKNYRQIKKNMLYYVCNKGKGQPPKERN